MQLALFFVVAVAVYLLSGRLVGIIYRKYEGQLPNRQIIFFIIFFALILVAFELLKLFVPTTA